MEDLGHGHGLAKAQPSRVTRAILHKPAGLTGAEARDVPKGMCSLSKDTSHAKDGGLMPCAKPCAACYGAMRCSELPWPKPRLCKPQLLYVSMSYLSYQISLESIKTGSCQISCTGDYCMHVIRCFLLVHQFSIDNLLMTKSDSSEDLDLVRAQYSVDDFLEVRPHKKIVPPEFSITLIATGHHFHISSVEGKERHCALPGAALPASPSPDLEGPSLGVRRQLRLHTFETFGISVEPHVKAASTAGEVCDVSLYLQETIFSIDSSNGGSQSRQSPGNLNICLC
ncbi:hypothetical protein DV515_00005879 [Chloebia gouldiae]|uniref:Uncharacterized protein n=1 Tax=Chloebia gouldiae TaxID=44316 RepID=A0A3L8SM78_CHLGU|nr:hypothetical protein DV515_00005879 [Chloebia gouldiae]